MQTFNALPIEALRILLATVAKHGCQHLLEIKADIQQTQDLTNDAIERLSQVFLRLNTKMEEQQKLIADLQTNECTQHHIELMQQHDKKMAEDIAHMVTSLQFQDMTNQLLEASVKRVEGLKILLKELARHKLPKEAGDEHEEILSFLAKLNAKLDLGNQHLTAYINKPVRQKTLNTGDIDIF